MNQLTQNWLHALCNMTAGVTRAVVFLKTQEKNGYGAAAFWPDKLDDYEDLSEAAKRVITDGNPILLDNQAVHKETGEPRDIIASPIYGVAIQAISYIS